MKSYPEDAGIQAEACVVLANICSTATAKDQLSASGCIETVVHVSSDIVGTTCYVEPY
jgi:hypothetical protein